MGEVCLQEIKNQFYDWCWLLSVEEISSNPRLMNAINKFERMLLSASDRAEGAVF